MRKITRRISQAIILATQGSEGKINFIIFEQKVKLEFDF